ncbi:Methylamine utilization MauG [Gossypium arboreum]|uniref:Methylamine utilization MauG n=1 Tax=Gossypium arboreum TaxID=29729 RepID=A0A0B0MIA2_GOSAR|nr:Methylamine utilization MauG [Gossypium arboreum]KHG00117.1 Methylamine utilization MauG [Gossypium arboreum]
MSSGLWPSWLVPKHHYLRPHAPHAPLSGPPCLAVRVFKTLFFLRQIKRYRTLLREQMLIWL